MSETKYTPTPGPWTTHKSFPKVVVPVGHETRMVGYSTDEAQDRTKYAYRIVEVWTNPLCEHAHAMTEPEAIANARLLAAAPDYADAVGRMLEVWRNWAAGATYPGNHYVEAVMNDLESVHARATNYEAQSTQAQNRATQSSVPEQAEPDWKAISEKAATGGGPEHAG